MFLLIFLEIQNTHFIV